MFVTIGIIALTSISIDATNSLQGSQSMLASLANRILAEECAAGTVSVLVAGDNWCVDTFPATPSPECPHQTIRSHVFTTENVAAASCQPVVKEGGVPWTHVAKHHAIQLCARAGKELLPANVWYQAALGTPSDETCHINQSAIQTNRSSECVSAVGAYDMVGNVWELVVETVENGVVGDRELPSTGYVHAVSNEGWPVETRLESSGLFSGDYVWSSASGTKAIMRGGFFRSQADAGIYTLHADIEPNFTSGATGFRCGYRL